MPASACLWSGFSPGSEASALERPFLPGPLGPGEELNLGEEPKHHSGGWFLLQQRRTNSRCAQAAHWRGPRTAPHLAPVSDKQEVPVTPDT